MGEASLCGVGIFRDRRGGEGWLGRGVCASLESSHLLLDLNELYDVFLLQCL